MTLDAFFTRVIRSHLVVIVLITLLPVGLVLAVTLAQRPPWQASVRIQATSVVPTSSTEADGLSSRVLGIATTPAVVRAAMNAARLRGDPVEISEKHVAAQRLGESPIVELTVTDADRASAQALVQQLSTRVITFMNTADRGHFEAAVEDVTRRLADSRAQRDRLFGQIQSTPPGTQRDRLKDLANEASQVAQELSSQRASLIMADVTRGRAVLVDSGSPEVLREPWSVLPRAGLALVLGLCLAVATAAAIETLRPKVPDARALARTLDTPMLTSIKQSPASLEGVLSLVARRNGLDTVVLLAADGTHQEQASSLAGALSRARTRRERVLDPVRSDAGNATAPTDQESDWATTTFVDLPSLEHRQEVSAGVAIVCSGPVSQARVEVLRDVLRATHWPLIGVLDAGNAWNGQHPDIWGAGTEEP